MTDDESRDELLSNIGIAVGISVLGVLVALVPIILSFGGVPATLCFLVAPVVAAAGVCFCTFEVDKMRRAGSEHYSNLGIGLLVATPGVSLLVARGVYKLPAIVNILLAVLGLGLAAFGLIGFFMGLAGVLGSRQPKRAPEATDVPGEHATRQGA